MPKDRTAKCVAWEEINPLTDSRRHVSRVLILQAEWLSFVDMRCASMQLVYSHDFSLLVATFKHKGVFEKA